MDILKAIHTRQSARVPFDAQRTISEGDLDQILESARWAPTAYNMQNFQVVVVDDRKLLDDLSRIVTEAPAGFVDKTYRQLSFSEQELKRQKVGLLGTEFPPSWEAKPRVDQEDTYVILGARLRQSAAVFIVLYEADKRAPTSDGEALGLVSLGCVMENMWLVASSLGIGFQVQSLFGAHRVQAELRGVLDIPERLAVGFVARLGYPMGPTPYLRVRREVTDFTHRNRFEPRAR
jgi:nitroreductase